MNCRDFEQFVSELSRIELVDGEKVSPKNKIAAFTHASACEACGARLAAERALSRSLSALAESTGSEQAPARVKQSLRAAFEARQANAASSNVIPMPVRQPLMKRPWVWALAAAAAIALALMVWRPQSSNQKDVVAGASPTPPLTPVNPAPKTSEPQTDATPKLVYREREVKPKRSPRPHPQPPAQENQLAASYIPLSYANASATPEESLVVRVEVPRTTLIAMGLPLNAERGNEMVKADLRVGLDGVPLAIRLVRQ
ncbi:MAG TPA: hypothetical protein PLQ88_10925 [Blastocatellia bacterium]|nr:hypothetical protein [Blastocatellia bacterium]